MTIKSQDASYKHGLIKVILLPYDHVISLLTVHIFHNLLHNATF